MGLSCEPPWRGLTQSSILPCIILSTTCTHKPWCKWVPQLRQKNPDRLEGSQVDIPEAWWKERTLKSGRSKGTVLHKLCQGPEQFLIDAKMESVT
jgi:hypothetical protein